MINESELVEEIQTLINYKHEGEYWDFKAKWHECNVRLLHDIICMSNSVVNRDCYIIIGVDDNGEVVGVVEADNDRKNQQNVINLMSQKPRWAGGIRPEVYVKTLSIGKMKVDVIIIKDSINTPFFLMEEYSKNKIKIKAGAIYTRKGDTNTPINSTAELYDAELLWKKRFGLQLEPSQRAYNYLKDIENWEYVEAEKNVFFYYKPDPNYTVHFRRDKDFQDDVDINDFCVGSLYYYLFSFCNVKYHFDFSENTRITAQYKYIPLEDILLTKIDEGRTSVVPPEYHIKPYYIQTSLRYQLLEFTFKYYCGRYSEESYEMIRRVVPVFISDDEQIQFMNYVKERGFEYKFQLSRFQEHINKQAKERLSEIQLIQHDNYTHEEIAQKLLQEKQLIANFASENNKDYENISKKLRIGKMLVDWLDEWRNNINC